MLQHNITLNQNNPKPRKLVPGNDHHKIQPAMRKNHKLDSKQKEFDNPKKPRNVNKPSNQKRKRNRARKKTKPEDINLNVSKKTNERIISF
jgi:hypothetical protein